MKKIEVNGDGADPLWVHMKAAVSGSLPLPSPPFPAAAHRLTQQNPTAARTNTQQKPGFLGFQGIKWNF